MEGENRAHGEGMSRQMVVIFGGSLRPTLMLSEIEEEIEVRSLGPGPLDAAQDHLHLGGVWAGGIARFTCVNKRRSGRVAPLLRSHACQCGP